MMLTSAIYTNIGDCAVNEDSAACIYTGSFNTYILADGLGGHGGGDVASKLVIDVISSIVSDESAMSVGLLERCFEVAQQRLLEHQKTLHREGAMKTTLVILLSDGSRAMWGHIGDSRLYHCHKGKVCCRTLDHSVPQMLVRMKKIKESDIRHHEERNCLLKVMGIQWSDGQMYEIDCKEIRLRKGDAFALCSDGFWELVEDSRIAQLVCQTAPVEDIVTEMGDEAYSNGLGTDRDNISVLIVKKV